MLVPVSDIATAIESGTRGLLRRKLLGEVEVNDLRGRIYGALRKSKPPSTNMTKEQKSALKDLRAMEGVTILPADKGNATVVMEREEYDSKMMELLLTSTYRELPKDPTQTMKNKISCTLRKYRKSKELPKTLYDSLRPSGCQPPRIYGLPKIHNPSVPLRPIVSCINSPTHALSKYISSIISPLAGQTDSYVRNSQHLVKEISKITLEMLRNDPELSIRTFFNGDSVPVSEKHLLSVQWVLLRAEGGRCHGVTSLGSRGQPLHGTLRMDCPGHCHGQASGNDTLMTPST